MTFWRFRRKRCWDEFLSKHPDASATGLFVKTDLVDRFATDVRGGVWSGGTVTYVCLQLAYFVTFERL